MKRMFARKLQTFRQRFLRRRRIKTLAWSGLSIKMMPGFMQLSDEAGEVFDRDRLRPVLALERFLDFLQREVAVELLEQEIFFDLEAKILEREWIFDDVVRHALIELRLHDQIGTQPDLEVLGGLAERLRRDL